MKLAPGADAPPFDLSSTAGGRVSLAGLKGKRFVLYFYPQDDTPGCTREACDFRESLARLGAAGVEVYGVSSGSLDSHEKFRKKFDLPFVLLTDADNSVATAYGAFGEKVSYGKKTVGSIRSTFLIDGDGRIARVWSPVRVDGHVEKVVAAAAGEGAG